MSPTLLAPMVEFTHDDEQYRIDRFGTSGRGWLVTHVSSGLAVCTIITARDGAPRVAPSAAYPQERADQIAVRAQQAAHDALI